jgi:hypothetical protein
MTTYSDPGYLDDLLSQPAAPETYADWLKKGLGRAVMLLDRQDPRQYHSQIEYACLNSLVYDGQCEPSRSHYLMPILDRSGDFNYFADLILNSYQNTTRRSAPHDLDLLFYQLEDLTTRLAERKYGNAENILFDSIEAQPVDGKEFHDDLANINLPRTLSLISRRIKLMPDEEDRVDTVGYAVKHMFQTGQGYYDIDTAAMEDALSAYADLSVYIKRYSDEITIGRTHPPTRRRLPRTYQQIHSAIMNIPKHWGLVSFRVAAKRMSKSDVLKLARDFQSENDPERIRRYLGVFAGARYPFGHKFILKHLQEEDKDLRHIVVLALSLIRHPSLHKLAEEMAAQGTIRESADLLESNFRPEDSEKLAEYMSPKLALEDWEKHSIGLSIVDISKRFGTKHLLQALFAAYENTPCCNCRGHAAEELFRAKSLPDWIISEIEFDSCYDFRPKFE